MKLILDAGALVAVDHRDRAVGAMLRIAQRDRINLVTSAAVVAQVWRDGSTQANLARVLSGCSIDPLDADACRAVGRLLARAGTSDVVDGHVARIAADGDRVLTSDASDLGLLLAAAGTTASIVAI